MFWNLKRSVVYYPWCFSCYLFDLARNIITQNTIKITVNYMIFNIKTVNFYFKILNSNPIQK